MARARGGPVSILWPKLYFDMEPDEEEVRHDILLLQKKMGDYTLPLQYSKQIIIGDVKKAFLSESDPVTGEQWKELSARASKVPRFGKLRRLQTGARMYRALTNRYNWGVTKEGVYLNVSRMPRSEEGAQYFVFHQQDDAAAEAATVKINKEDFMRKVATRMVELGKTRAYEGKPNRSALIKEDAIQHVADRVKAGIEGGMAGGRIPRRRMIGPSPEAEKKITQVFDAWARDVITIYRRGGPGGIVVMTPRRGMKL